MFWIIELQRSVVETIENNDVLRIQYIAYDRKIMYNFTKDTSGIQQLNL